MMLEVYAVYKVSTVWLIAAVLGFAVDSYAAPPSGGADNSTSYLGLAPIPASSQREVYSTSRRSKSSDIYVCEGHKLNVSINVLADTNLEGAKAVETNVVSVDIRYDGRKIDLPELASVMQESNHLDSFGVNFLCINGSVGANFFGYGSARPHRPITLYELALDLETGEVLPEIERRPF